MIGAIADAVGAGGVIVSLLYLGVQVRASNRATQRTNAHEFNAGYRALWGLISSDGTTAALWQKGLADYDKLTSVESLRFSTLMFQVVTVWEERYYALKDSDLPEWAATTSQIGQREIVSLPGFRRWYELRGHWLSPEYRAAIESDMALSSASVAPFYLPEDEVEPGGQDGPAVAS
jgi:hypothetical protein